MIRTVKIFFTLTLMLLCIPCLTQGQSIFSERPIDATYKGASAIDIKDINNDGKPDIIAASHGTPSAPSSGVKCWINNGPSPVGFTGQIIDAGYQSITCYAEDLNGDGFTDVIAGSWTANSIKYWLNSGSSPIVWTPYTLTSNFRNTHGVYAGDFDGDGDNDILGAAAGINQISLWINNGGNPISWTKNTITDSFPGVRSVYGGDVDEDGDLDFVATALTGNELAWWRNEGGDPVSWSKFTLATDFSGAHWAIFFDIDQDTHLDILGAAWADSEISWWKNNSDDSLTWTKYSIDTAFTGGFYATAADFDNDGDIDIFGTSQPVNLQSYWINGGGFPYEWTRRNLTSSNSQPWPAAPIDADADGRVDIVSGGNAMLGWWENISNVPNPPTGFIAESDHITPTSIHLKWFDPSTRVDNNLLTQFSIHLYRGLSLIAVIDSGVQQYTDELLINHQVYTYSIRAVAHGESSNVVTASAYAGGCPYALPPTLFTVRDSTDGIQLQWKNPARYIDGSLLNEPFFLMIYRDEVSIDSVEQTHLDTGQVRHYYDMSQGYHEYQLRIRDADSIPHYSSWTVTLLGYGGVPGNRFLENFESGSGIPYHTGTWDTTQIRAFQGKYSFTDSPTGNSPNYSNVSFLLPPVIVDDTLLLRFFEIAIVIPGNKANVEISRDGRKTFSKIAEYDWEIYEPWQDGSADPADWKERIIDLAPYIGDTITIRFRLYTSSGYTSDGWYIDSMRIQPPDLPDPAPKGTIFVRSGWNLVSLPLESDDMNKTTIFSSSSSFAFTYDNGYVIRESLQAGTGYWIKYEAAGEITMEGGLVTSDTIDIQVGWNMIGPLNTSIEITGIEPMPEDLSCSQFFGYDSIYQTADTLKPGTAYWVKADRSGRLVLKTSVANCNKPKMKIIHTDEQPPRPPFGEERALDLSDVPAAFFLLQNYPNPFNPSTTIGYTLPYSTHVTLSVFNTLSQLLAVLVDEKQEAGCHRVSFNGSGLANGVYFYQLRAGSFILTKKLLMVK